MGHDDLNRQMEEVENTIAALQKNKISLTTQLEDTKKLGDGEARDRASILTKYKNLSTEAENLRIKIDEENEKKNDVLKALSKVQAEIQLWKSKYETEALGRIEELEGGRVKLASRVNEAEESIDNLNAKIASAEKAKNRLDAEIDDLSMEYERTHAAATITEKRGRNFDKVLGEWKAKSDDLLAELDACSSECRNFNAEKARLKAAFDEASEGYDIVKRENKNLADEIKDLIDQLELATVKQEIDKKVGEKEEEFNNTRKNHGRAMDSMQASLETEQKAKAEALRAKKKLEGEINEFEIALDHSNKATKEAMKTIKRYQGQVSEHLAGASEAGKDRQDMAEKASLAGRRANALQGEVEEARALLDSAERGKKQVEAELGDARAAVTEMNSVNAKAGAEKRRFEGDLHTAQAEVDDLLHGAKASEEKAKKAMVDAARLADELRAEQDHVSAQAKAKQTLERQMADLETNLADANTAALRGGKSAIAKLESRIRDLEIELGNVQAHSSDNLKAYQKAERKIKELQFQNDEDKKNQDRMSELATKLQSKIKTYKKQIEEAEEIAALNLAKFRK